MFLLLLVSLKVLQRDIFGITEALTIFFNLVPRNLYSFSKSEKKVFIDSISK